MKRYWMTVVLLMALCLVCVGCSTKKADYVDDGIASIDFTDNSGIQVEADTEAEEQADLFPAYTYPDNPIEELRSHLERDANERGLPISIGEITQGDGGWQNRMEFEVQFLDHENPCVFSFTRKSDGAIADYYSLDGKDNPSFTIAFFDPENSQDMITILASVMRYLSPDLSASEAERLAIRQDETISIDGYSLPQEVGGYQVQSHYTAPYDYFSTTNFKAQLGVSIRAIKQLFETDIDVNQCQKLSTASAFRALDDPRSLLDDDAPYDNISSKIVYADFIIKDFWEYVEWVHGDPTTFVKVESTYGTEHVLVLDRLRVFYELGIGETYTLFIHYHYGDAKILYAIQQTDHVQGD